MERPVSEPAASEPTTQTPAAARPTPGPVANPFLRAAYFAFGILTFCLAMLGIVVRGLPTTPFLLLSAFAFARSSPRLHRWLMTHPRFGPLLSDLQSGRGLTFRFKAATIAFSWSLMLATAIFLVPSWTIRGVLIGAALIQLYVFVRVIPTRPQAA